MHLNNTEYVLWLAVNKFSKTERRKKSSFSLAKTVSRLTETDRNGPELTETDLRNYRNGLLWVPKRTSMGTRKGRVGFDRNDPNKVM